MGVMYFIDNKLKRYLIRGKGLFSPAETGAVTAELSCIREYDVNIWLYSSNGIVIAFDSGHLDYPYVDREFSKLGIDRHDVKHLFLTHADNDHVGGVDINGRNIFPDAKIYIGKEEKNSIDRKEVRFRKGFFRLKTDVTLPDGVTELEENETIIINDIRVESFFTPGHTRGHTCYIINNEILITGDCIAINSKGGFSFFDFFTQNIVLNKKSVKKLQEHISGKTIKLVCTGHSGVYEFSEKTFKFIEHSAAFSANNPFDPEAPYDPYNVFE